jgi:predicted MPP superfamily phosphohydrolase
MRKDLRDEAGFPANLTNLSFWVGAALALCGLRGRAAKNLLRVTVTERQEFLPSLPEAFDGLRLLHLSDLHFDLVPELAGVVRGIARGLEFDLVAATGDYREKLTPRGEEGVRLSAELFADIGKPVYACLGNHDRAGDVATLEAAGAKVLVNESVPVFRDGTAIHLCGVDDPGLHRGDNFVSAFRDVPPGATSILLAHDPVAHIRARAAGVSLMLCGHTHGGQICLPGGRPILAHTRAARCFRSGAWRDGPLAGYTSRGVGVTAAAVRLFCPGEIVIHTLRRGDPAP